MRSARPKVSLDDDERREASFEFPRFGFASLTAAVLASPVFPEQRRHGPSGEDQQSLEQSALSADDLADALRPLSPPALSVPPGGGWSGGYGDKPVGSRAETCQKHRG